MSFKIVYDTNSSTGNFRKLIVRVLNPKEEMINAISDIYLVII